MTISQRMRAWMLSCARLIRSARTPLLVSAATIVAGSAHASYDVSPIRQQLTWNARATFVEIRNRGIHAAHFEVEPMTWQSNVDGTSQTSPTEDVTATPRQFDLKPGTSQIVRVFFHAAPDPVNEQRWRIFLREQSRGGFEPSPTEGSTVQVLFHLSTPIFRIPKGAQAQLDWSVGVVEGQNVFSVTNRGARYALLSEFKNADGTIVEGVSGYVLPGQTRKFLLPTDNRSSKFSYRLSGDPDPSVRTVKLLTTP